MTASALELSLLLPRASGCGACVEEVGRELLRLDGVHAVEADVPRGLLTISFDEAELTSRDVETFARRSGALAHCADHCPLATHEHGPLDLHRPLPHEGDGERRLLHVTGMDCSDCAVKLQAALRRENGVRDARVNFGAATLAIDFDPSCTNLDAVYRAVRRLGYDTAERRGPHAAHGGASQPPGIWRSEPRAQLTLASGVLVAAGFAAGVVAPAAAPWFFAAATAAGGAYVARAAAYSLRARQVDMNVLMTLAMVGAAAIGQWSEAALVAFLFGVGTNLQAATLERTRRAIAGLMDLVPPLATIVRRDSGAEAAVPVDEVAIDDLVVVRPGERVAVDGVVVEGIAGANEAPVTGESALVAKGPGDQVFAGSVIEGGALRLRATAAAADATIAKIVHMVEDAQAQRAPMQSTVDRFAARYTPIVVALAAAVAFVPPLLGASFDTWFYRGLALLIISCPCALVISTPVSILAALTRATRNGVLIKGGVHLERMAGVKAVAFDKTGTLTLGAPRVTDVVALRGFAEAQVLAVAAALERYSEHPSARAIATHAASSGAAPTLVDCACAAPGCCAEAIGHSHAADGGLSRHAEGTLVAAGEPRVERFHTIAGMGVRAELNGRLHFAGRPELLGAHAADADLLAAVADLERQGKTVVAVGDEAGAIGVIAVSDPLRPGAADAIAALRRLGVSDVTMLTGDNATTAAAVATAAGIDDVHADLLPDDKVAAVAALRDRVGAVAMVGDGVNDAPALAAASIGIAMGAAGTDAALETADIALMGDDLGAVPDTIELGRRTARVIWQNIAFSLVVKAVFLALAPLGLVTLWLAVFADMGTSLLVTANGLRLLRR